MPKFKIIGLLFLLLLTTPGAGETAGLEEVRHAVALWNRVFVRLPALEQFLRTGKPPQASDLKGLGVALESVSQEEGLNPFLPLARGILGPMTGGAFEAAAAVEASSKAGDRVAVRWLLYRTYLRLGEWKAADRELRHIQAIRDRFGLDRIAYIGWDLIRLAEEHAARGDRQGVDDALTLAEEFSPGDPRVLFAKAGILLRRGSPGALGSLVKGWWISLTSPMYAPSQWANVLASLLTAIPLGLLFVGLLLILRVTPLFKHDLAEWTRRRYAPTTEVFLLAMLYLLPIFLGLGLLPAVLLCLLPLGIYLTGRERLLLGGLVLLVLLLPAGYQFLATMLTSTSSPRFEALLQVEEGNRAGRVEAELRRWAEEAPHDLLPRFYLGRVRRARGRLAQADESYAQAQVLAPHEAAIWNNRGNLALLAGDLHKAQSAYQKAIGLGPGLAEAHFNLSQVLMDSLRLEEAEKEYAKAIHQMPSLRYRLHQDEGGEGKMVALDAPLPVDQVRRRVLSLESPSPEMAEFLWGRRFLGVPLSGLPWVAGGYLLAFGVSLRLRKHRRFARACRECGRAFCARCQRVLGEVRLCTRCAIMERARAGEMPHRIKNIPAEAPHWEPRWIRPTLSLIPGMEGMYRGRTLWGFFLLATTCIVVSPLLGRFLTPTSYLTENGMPYTFPASLVLLLFLYLLAAATDSRTRHRRQGSLRWH